MPVAAKSTPAPVRSPVKWRDGRCHHGARFAVLTFEGERASVDAVAISPDGRHLVASGGGVRLWSLADPTAESIELTGGPAVGSLPDGRLVVAGNMVLIANPDAPHKGAARFEAREPVGEVLDVGRLLAITRDALILSAVQGGGVRA